MSCRKAPRVIQKGEELSSPGHLVTSGRPVDDLRRYQTWPPPTAKLDVSEKGCGEKAWGLYSKNLEDCEARRPRQSIQERRAGGELLQPARGRQRRALLLPGGAVRAFAGAALCQLPFLLAPLKSYLPSSN